MNLLEIRSEEIKEMSAEDAARACAQLSKIMSASSNYNIKFNQEHAAPTLENSYIGEFEEVNRFTEGISGRALFFPNTEFLYKSLNGNIKTEVIALYIINTVYGFKMVVETETDYNISTLAVNFKRKLYSEKLSDELYYTVQENQVRGYYARRISEAVNDLNKLDRIEFFAKKSGLPFKDLSKCIKWKSWGFNNYYALEFQEDNKSDLINRDYLNGYNIKIVIDDLIKNCGTVEERNAGIISELKNEIKHLKATIQEDIKHYQEIFDNVRELVNEYSRKTQEIEAIKSTLNHDINIILGA